MSKSRLQNSRRKTRKSPVKSKQVHRFIGLSLSGGKTDKACLAVLEYYPEQNRVFLARLFEKIKGEEKISADLKIHEILQQYQNEVEFLAVDTPLSLPKCVTCTLKCPGYEACDLEEMIWLREHYAKANKKKRPKKMFTPYTQRCVEAYLNTEIEEALDVQHALGSNMAPLTARAIFIARRIKAPMIEVIPRLSVWRLGTALKVGKIHSKFHRHSVGGDESRKILLQAFAEKKNIFFYQQDTKLMTENNHAFEAFICAYTAFLKFKEQTQERPRGFPQNEAWVEFPRE